MRTGICVWLLAALLGLGVLAGAVYASDSGIIAYGFRTAFAGCSGLERDVAQELRNREAIVQEVSAGNFDTRQINAVFEGLDGSSLEVQIERTLSDRRIPFTAEYSVENLPEGARVKWDFDHTVDSNHDGLFRNDADAVGSEVQGIYPTNRTPKIVTARIITPDGREFTWEDQVSFNVQNGDTVLLDAKGFLEDVMSVRWEVSNGDPRDRNFRIASPTGKQATLVSEYPGVTHVILNATDRDGNQHTYDTTLYVFNKNPNIFKVRGVITGIWLSPDEYGCLHRAFSYLQGIGFNSIRIGISWFFEELEDGSYKIYPWPREEFGCDIHTNCDEGLENIISFAHEHGFRVELPLVIDSPPGRNLNRNWVPMNEKFFEGPNGYFNFVRHYIEIANRTGVEVFVGKIEIGSSDTYAARPWMDKLIEIMHEGLTNSEYSLENFYETGRGIPQPWDPFYGTNLSKLELIEWSAYGKLGSHNNASISEMVQAFKWNQLRNFSLVHQRFPHLRQVIGELGVPSVDGGGVIFSGAITPNTPIDYEEQRRGAAAILRALMEYIQEGNEFFEGWFWHSLTICNEWNKIPQRNDFPIWGKPAMEEFYAFYSSEPKLLPVVPYFNNIYGIRYYINEFQDVHLIQNGGGELLENFEGSRNYREHLGAWGIFFDNRFANARARIVTGNAYEGNQSLEVSINTPYGRGADVAVSPRFPVGNWDDVKAVSIAIKRMDASLGAALIIPNAQNPSFSYTVRLPVSKVGEWEHFVIPIADFVTLGTNGQYMGIQDRSALSKWDIHVVFYPTTEDPLETKVYIDSLGVVRSH